MARFDTANNCISEVVGMVMFFAWLLLIIKICRGAEQHRRKRWKLVIAFLALFTIIFKSIYVMSFVYFYNNTTLLACAINYYGRALDPNFKQLTTNVKWAQVNAISYFLYMSCNQITIMLMIY